MLVFLALTALAAETADPAAVRRDLATWEAALEKDGKYPLKWTDEELAQLATGDVVKRRTKLDGADWVMGAVWTPAGLDETWAAVQDDGCWGLVDGLIEETLPGTTYQDKILYQRIEAPWPFKDRQWVIRVQNTQPVWASTDKKVIERVWFLTPERGAKNESEDGIWVNVNEGGWFAAPVAGGTVVAYHVRAVVGGNIPDDAASTWTMMTLGGMLRSIVEHSVESKTHYTGDHTPIRWPDGSEVPRF